MRLTLVQALTFLMGCSDETPSTEAGHSEEAMPLHPDFPIIEGHYQMTKDWSVTLPSQFNRRIEEGQLVIWKPGFTVWTNVWNNDNSESQEERLQWIQSDPSPDAFGKITESSDGLSRYSYRLKEDSDDDRVPAFYCFAIGEDGHVQMAMYFDSEGDLANAQAIWRSLTENR